MLWTEKLFGVKKPIIAMLHLDPLPGDPLYKKENDMDVIIEHARADLPATSAAVIRPEKCPPPRAS